MIKLSSQQIQKALNNKAVTKDGINEMLKLTLNALMHGERQAFLRKEKDPTNKANGYRPVKVNGYGRQLALSIPRDRLGTL